MKICCISDTHGKHRDLDLSEYKADVLIHAGDWTGGRDLGLSETAGFLSWFSQQPFTYKICIAGNHEVQVEAGEDHFRELLLMYPDIIYLQDSSVTIKNINFYGSPYSNEFFDWAFMEDEYDLINRWRLIPYDTNVLITHGPAYGCHDLVKHAYGRDPHVGSKSLTKRKQELLGTLKCHISGHIHENGSKVVTSGNLQNVCASVLDEKYQLVNNPIITEVTND